MVFEETELQGCYVIELEKHGDERGFFARFFCRNEFRQQGLVENFVQINNSLSKIKGTLRGLHYQLAPKAETKIVRCIQGAILDVVVDLRPSSDSYLKHVAIELSAANRKALYVPKGFAHGFLSLTENTEVFYLVDEYYAPEYERGIRYDDPTFAIPWPAEPTVLSDKDRAHPDFSAETHLQ